MNHFTNPLKKQSVAQMYILSAQRASRMLFRNWPCLVGMCLLFAAVTLAQPLIAPLGIIGGFLLGFLVIACLTLYYRWVRSSCDEQKISWKNLFEFDAGLFSSIMNAGFFLWIISLVNGSLAQSESTKAFSVMISVALFIFLNPLPEIVYRDEEDAMGSLRRTAQFLQAYWIEWLLPLGLLLAPLLAVSFAEATSLMAETWVLLPVLAIFQAADFALYAFGFTTPSEFGQALRILAPLLIAHWFMLFRGFLFIELSKLRRV